MKISLKIGIFAIIIALVPMMIVGISGYVKSYNMLLDNQVLATEQTVESVEKQITKVIDDAKITASVLADDLNRQGIEAGFESFYAIASNYDDYMYAYFGVEETGDFLIAPETEMPENFDPRKRPWYGIAKDESPVVSEPYIDAASGQMIVTVSKAVFIDGKRVGVVGVDLDFGNVSKQISSIQIGETGYPFVLYKDGKVLIHHNNELIGKDLIGKLPFLKTMVEMKNGFMDYDYKGEKFASMRTIDEIGWTICGGTYYAEIKAPLNTLRNFSLIVAILAVIASLIGVFFMTRNITHPLNRAIDGLTAGSGEVTSAANHISSSSQSLAEGTSQQAASIEETSSSMEEMASMTRRNAENADMADTLTQEAGMFMQEADTSMAQLTRSMEDISSASEETSKIIKTIDEIAFQTNLLALNAAVEAARAGEAGAGFAVVADEVRNLAMRAADAAKDTAGLIQGTVAKVEEGSKLVNTTSDTFTKVAEAAQKVTVLVSEITEASKEQSEGISQVNNAITEMDRVVQHNAANAEESASAAEEMNAQASQMQDFVEDLLTLVSGKKGKKMMHNKMITLDSKTVAHGGKQLPASPSIQRAVNQDHPGQMISFKEEDTFSDFYSKAS